MNSFMANPDKIERKWYVVDAEGCICKNRKNRRD